MSDWMKPYDEEDINKPKEAIVDSILSNDIKSGIKLMKCPSCGQDDLMKVKANANIVVSKQGNLMGCHIQWNDDSKCSCPSCNWMGDFIDTQPNSGD